MNKTVITADDLIKYMGEDTYYEFVSAMRMKNNIKDGIPMAIVMEFGD